MSLEKIKIRPYSGCFYLCLALIPIEIFVVYCASLHFQEMNTQFWGWLSIALILLIGLFGLSYSASICFEVSRSRIVVYSWKYSNGISFPWDEFQFAYIHINGKGGRVLLLSREQINTRKPRQWYRLLGFMPILFHGVLVMEPDVFSDKKVDLILPFIPNSLSPIIVPKVF